MSQDKIYSLVAKMSQDSSSEAAERLLPASSFEEEHGERVSTPRPSKRSRLFFSISFTLNIVAACYVLFLHVYGFRHNVHPLHQDVFSPAQSAIQYETVTFNDGSEAEGEQSPYLGISDAADAAWNELDFAIMRIDRESAKKLSRPTMGIPGDPGQYVITLDVFHQLHCLNVIRKTLFPEKYDYWKGSTPELEYKHKVHCVEQLRQAVMCASDVTAIPWKWREESQESFPSSVTEHTCRNFTSIHEWAKEHALPGGWTAFDGKTRINL